MKNKNSTSRLKIGTSNLSVNSAEAIKSLQKNNQAKGLREVPDIDVTPSKVGSNTNQKVVINLPEKAKAFINKR